MKEKQKHDYLDELIKKAVKEDYENITIESNKKEQQWDELMSALNQMKRKSRPKKLHTLLATISASMLLLLSLSFFQTESGSAFGWLKKIFVEEEGIITKVKIMSEEEKEKNNETESSIILDLAKYVTFPSIEEAEKEINKKIFVPSYLPKSTNLLEVRIFYHQNDFAVERIEQIYLYSSNETIKIAQKNNIFSSAYHFDNEDSLITQELLTNKDGVFINYKDDINKLMWLQEQYTFTIEANLTQTEIFKIAKSIK